MNIVVGVSGSIAAYKAVDFVNQLHKSHHNVRVVMTKNATAFVTPLTFEAISHNKCIVDMFAPDADALEHISLAKWADLCVIAPADANVIAKIANGLADDFLTTFTLAFDGPVLIAPAMNTVMYEQAVTQKSIQMLKSYGFDVIEPAIGVLACGDDGRGKLASIETLLFAVEKALTKQSLEELKVIVSAGPTIGKIDPVRYVTNHSSGKMGFSIAKEAVLRGAEVTLVAGHIERETPLGAKRINVDTTQEMRDAIETELAHADVLIMAAAPADYAPKEYHEEKIKKADGELVISFSKNIDILKSLKPYTENKVVVGFAAESHNLLENAQKKLEAKNLDFIVANNIAGPQTAFKSNYNAATIIFKNGSQEEVPRQLKSELAGVILNHIETIIKNREER